MTRPRRTRRFVALGLVGAVLAAAVTILLPPRALDLPPGPPDPRLVRGSLHVHTRRSDGAGTVDDAANAARAAGLDFVVFADHGDATRPPDPPAYRAGVLCIDAVEISTTGGHYMALGLGRSPYRLAGEPRDVVDDVRRLGGFGIVTHPESPKPELRWDGWSLPFDGLEWLNADSEWRDEPALTLVKAFSTYFFRSRETIASLFNRPAALLSRWDALTRERRVVGVAGHDAHARIGLRGNWEPSEGDIALRLPGYESAFRAFGVRARLADRPSGDASRDAALLLDAIRAGHVFTVLDAVASPARLSFDAEADGVTVQAGDDLQTTAPVRLEAHVTPAPGVALALIRDGEVVATADGPDLRFTHPGGATRTVYRVEARLAGRVVPGAPWIVSNPIYVGPPVPSEPAVAPVVIDARAFPVAGTGDAWVVEREPRSEGRVVRMPDGDAIGLHFGLAGGIASGQYAALVHHLARGSAAGWDQVTFRGAAAAPMRMSVQVRAPSSERWIRSVYLDTVSRSVTVRFDDMRPVEPGVLPHPRLRDIDSLLFVVDTVNTTPGSAGDVRISQPRLERVAGETHVRTVSSR